MKYTEKMNEIVIKATNTFDTLSAQQKTLDADHSSGDISDKAYHARTHDLKRNQDEVILNAKRMIDELNKMYRFDVLESTIVYGDMLHDDAKLLRLEDLGFVLSPLQFTALVRRHEDNPLMTQLLYRYKMRHLKVYQDHFILPEEKISAFQIFANSAQSVVQNPTEKLKRGIFLKGTGLDALKICTEEMPKKDEDDANSDE